MMIVRASQLGRIDKRAERNLWIAMSKRGWRKEEPLDDVLDPEKPGMLREAVELLIDERIQTRSQIRWALPFGQSDIEALCGLERGYLKPKRGRLVGLRKIMNQERMKS